MIDDDKQVEAAIHTDPLTVKVLIESLSTFPQDTMVVAGIEGAGITVALAGAMVVKTEEDINLTILILDRKSLLSAMKYVNAQDDDSVEKSN